jgi:hypothetical protein
VSQAEEVYYPLTRQERNTLQEVVKKLKGSGQKVRPEGATCPCFVEGRCDRSSELERQPDRPCHDGIVGLRAEGRFVLGLS